jgi:hypothetical protein
MTFMETEPRSHASSLALQCSERVLLTPRRTGCAGVDERAVHAAVQSTKPRAAADEAGHGAQHSPGKQKSADYACMEHQRANRTLNETCAVSHAAACVVGDGCRQYLGQPVDTSCWQGVHQGQT